MRLIDADALKQNIEIWREQLVDTYGINDEYAKCLGSVIDYIDDALTEEERKKGKWNKTCVPDVYQCDVCKKPVKMDEFCDSEVLRKFCPNCGADMRGGRQ